ncbi:MAG: cyclic nucleotide-binding domain-containing protein, partial [Hyphomicrobiaceae bacterium]|nr:cyclic nucleotide-binding domain-containing protein [Hyphomicrobiaceae bacterium]
MIDKTAIVELLGNTQLFGSLEETDQRAVADEMREVSFAANQVIFARGDAGREIYLVVSGRVRLSVLSAEGRELSFAHAEPGAIFGEIAMLDGGTRTADATAVNKVTAL